MKAKKKTASPSIYENDFDNDSWIGKKEVSFSSKLLVAVGEKTHLDK